MNKDTHDLPVCIQRVLESANQLRESLFSRSFPDLDEPPPTDDAAHKTVEAFHAWFIELDRRYMALANEFIVTGGSVILPSHVFGSLPEPFQRSPGVLFDELWEAFDRSGRLENPWFDSVAFESANDELTARMRERHPYSAEVKAQSWDAVRAILRDTQQFVLTRAALLLQWIDDRASAYERAALPKIELIHQSERFRVYYAGREREVELSGEAATALQSLLVAGSATISYRAKRELLAAIPEIGPWLGQQKIDGNNTLIDAPALRPVNEVKPSPP